MFVIHGYLAEALFLYSGRYFLWPASSQVVSMEKQFLLNLIGSCLYIGALEGLRACAEGSASCPRLVQFIFTLSRSPWMMKGPAESTRMSSQHASWLLVPVWCGFSWLFHRNTVLACVQLVWWLFWMRFCSLLAGQAKLNQLKSVSELSLPITNHAYLAAVAALISVSLHDHRLTSLTTTQSFIYQRVTIQSLLALLSEPVLDLVKGDCKQIKWL